MSDVDKENIAHLLATMHQVLRDQDGKSMDCGQYQHLTNRSYEQFVERFLQQKNILLGNSLFEIYNFLSNSLICNSLLTIYFILTSQNDLYGK